MSVACPPPLQAGDVVTGRVGALRFTLDEVRALSKDQLRRRPAWAYCPPPPGAELAENSWASRIFAATELHGEAWLVNATQGSLRSDGGLRYTLHVSLVTPSLHAWATDHTEGDVVVSPALQLAR